MKFMGILVLLLVVLPFASSIRINEIEANPEGGTSNVEWVEIYNEGSESVDISGWSLYDGLASEKKRFTFLPDTIIAPKDFFIVEFSRAVLNNGGEYLILYDEDQNEIDRTEKVTDSSPGTETWQYCDGDWVFSEETKNEENDCSKSISESKETKEETTNEEITNTENLVEETDSSEENEKTFEVEDTPEVKEPDVFDSIELNSKVIKSQDNKVGISKSVPIFLLTSFLLMVVLLLLLKRMGYSKNEFD